MEMGQGWVRWETCLRQMFFGHEESLESPSQFEIYRGRDAYRFCLHTVCGLKSPMVGETEVWGQFKALFREFDFESHPAGSALQGFVQNIFADAKSIRHRYLTGLGSQSYGSLARKLLRGQKEINIIGAGLLVKDMLPWLCKGQKVRIFCRRPEQGLERVAELKDQYPVEVQPLSALSNEVLSGGLIIAAPVSAESLVSALGAHKLKKIIDLRDDSTKDPVRTGAEVLALSEFFNEIQSTQKILSERVQKAEDEIQRMVEKRFNQMHIRPQGWDDLCC